MIVKEIAVLTMYGEEFSPAAAAAQLGLKFSTVHERGEIGTIGRYRGQPIPYGAASIEIESVPSTGAHTGELEGAALLADQAGKSLGVLRALGADEITLHVDICFDAQCNFVILPETLHRIARMGIGLSISCYSNDQ
jgi:hypothetical protein